MRYSCPCLLKNSLKCLLKNSLKCLEHRRLWPLGYVDFLKFLRDTYFVALSRYISTINTRKYARFTLGLPSKHKACWRCTDPTLAAQAYIIDARYQETRRSDYRRLGSEYRRWEPLLGVGSMVGSRRVALSYQRGKRGFMTVCLYTLWYGRGNIMNSYLKYVTYVNIFL